MSYTIQPGPRSGLFRAPSSKSHLHRLLILAALGRETVRIRKVDASGDVTATARCLTALGAPVREEADSFTVTPFPRDASGRLLPDAGGELRVLPCAESGATLRFMMALAGLRGSNACLLREGRLTARPIAPFDAALRAHGMTVEERGANVYVSGTLRSGIWQLPGNVSSQFTSALLLSLPFADGDSVLRVQAPVESSSYVDMTEQALELAGAAPDKAQLAHKNGGALAWDDLFWIAGGRQAALPRETAAEGDFSAAAVFLCIGALSPQGLAVTGLSPRSRQGDMAILDILQNMGADIGASPDVVAVRHAPLKAVDIDASQVPDLVPPLAVLAATAMGDTRFLNAGRLRLKESDRLAGTLDLLHDLGVQARVRDDVLQVHGGTIRGGSVRTLGDHRLAMAAAAAACAAREPVTIDDADCVAKSFAGFWNAFGQLQR